MTEHRHEWYVAAMVKGEPFASCKHCELVLIPRRIDERLNATEELLEAAKKLVEELDRDVFDAGIGWAAQPALEQAIAKAEGR